MSEAIKKLKSDYRATKKTANTREERQKIRADYLEMKKMLKQSDKVLKDGEKGLKAIDKMFSDLPKLPE